MYVQGSATQTRTSFMWLPCAWTIQKMSFADDEDQTLPVGLLANIAPEDPFFFFIFWLWPRGERGWNISPCFNYRKLFAMLQPEKFFSAKSQMSVLTLRFIWCSKWHETRFSFYFSRKARTPLRTSWRQLTSGFPHYKMMRVRVTCPFMTWTIMAPNSILFNCISSLTLEIKHWKIEWMASEYRDELRNTKHNIKSSVPRKWQGCC